MRRLAIFGSTGSVGRQALEVAASLPGEIEVVCLAAGQSVARLAEQALRFHPRLVVIGNPALRAETIQALGPRFAGEVLAGPQGLQEAAALPEVDTVLAAVTGSHGLPISLAAVRSGKRLALANKESLVAAGPLITEEARRTGADILPVDSEHSAIFQALQAGRPSEVSRLILTASGGPFRTRALETWHQITVKEALQHPTWDMGPKITVDSATMMNKALEILEAHHLFQVEPSRIQVVIHPQSVVHSLVAFRDGSVVAQMGLPDMRIPIQYALTYPERLPFAGEEWSPAGSANLTFEEPDLDRFPSLRLGWEAAQRGGLCGAVLNAANERAVELFLAGEIPFPSIVKLVSAVMTRHRDGDITGLEAVLEADRWAREEVLQCL